MIHDDVEKQTIKVDWNNIIFTFENNLKSTNLHSQMLKCHGLWNSKEYEIQRLYLNEDQI